MQCLVVGGVVAAAHPDYARQSSSPFISFPTKAFPNFAPQTSLTTTREVPMTITSFIRNDIDPF